jgi:predicted O-methyltransferase YrrM
MLITGCASLGLLERDGEQYVNSALADEFLVRGRPYYFGGFVQMLDRRLYPGWDKLVQALHANRPTTWDPDSQESLFDGEDPNMLALFWEAMHSLSTFTARSLGMAIDLSGVSRLLDVGGGSGAYDIELCRRYPHLRATVFDLPFVTDIAARKVEEAALSDRIATMGGDFFSAPLPGGHDAVLLSMILHDWNEEQDREILRTCYEALPNEGTIIISELLVNDEKRGPPAAALMSLNMLIEQRPAGTIRLRSTGAGWPIRVLATCGRCGSRPPARTAPSSRRSASGTETATPGRR